MADTAHDPRLFYAAIVTRLGTSTGMNIGAAEEPDVTLDSNSKLTDPYGIVYPVREDFDGSLSEPHIIDVWRFQVTCVGRDMTQAQWMQQKVRAGLLGHVPTVSGLRTTAIRLLDGSGIERDTDFTPHRFYSTDRYEMYST